MFMTKTWLYSTTAFTYVTPPNLKQASYRQRCSQKALMYTRTVTSLINSGLRQVHSWHSWAFNYLKAIIPYTTWLLQSLQRSNELKPSIDFS